MKSPMVAALAAGLSSLFATAALACTGDGPCSGGPTPPEAGFTPPPYEAGPPQAPVFAGPEPHLYGAPVPPVDTRPWPPAYAPSRYGPSAYDIGPLGPRPVAPPAVAPGPCGTCIAEAPLPPVPAEHHHHLPPPGEHGPCAVHSACAEEVSEAGEAAPALTDTFFMGGLSGGAGPGVEVAWYSGGGGGFSIGGSGFAAAQAWSRAFAFSGAHAFASAKAIAIAGGFHGHIPHKVGCGCVGKHGK